MDELPILELDAITGGDSNYKECGLGTKAGGSAGLYPWYVVCNDGGVGSSFGAGALKGAAGGGGGGAT